MKLAFILDPLESLRTYKDSSYAMMREAAARGHQLYVMEQQDVLLRDHIVQGQARPLDLRHEETPWHVCGAAQWLPLAAFDAVFMRKDPPFDMEYVYSTYLLELAEGQGARILNRPSAVRDFNEKLAIERFAPFTAPTLVSRRMDVINDFIDTHQDVILKPLSGMGGAGVFRVRRDDPNRNVIIETMTQLGTASAMAQRYIPEITAGDKRILIVDGQPAPYALARIPAQGETRGNLAAGGRGVAQPLSARDLEIATTLGPELKARGLLLVGLDVIGDYLTEVNVTSPTGMQEIFTQTGFSVAAMMIDAVERMQA
jgi:glutathione synthase